MATNTFFEMVKKQRWIKMGSIGVALIYYSLLSPLFGITIFSPLISDCFNNNYESAKILLSFEAKDFIYSIVCESDSFKTNFFTNVNVVASVTYPRVPETNFLSHTVNETLRKEAYELHNTFVQGMSVCQENLCEEDADDYVFHYELDLVCSTPYLLSFYGLVYQNCGGAHGTVRYMTKTFLEQNGVVSELTLNDLFLPGYREWLFQYCEDYFKSHRCGYYSYDDYSWVGFNPEHLNSFLLTEKGLLLIFQNYVISGFDDYPVTLLIPYAELTSISNFDQTWLMDSFSLRQDSQYF